MDREWEKAKEAVFLAEHHFNQAAADDLEIDAAIHALCAAEMQLRRVLRERRHKTDGGAFA